MTRRYVGPRRRGWRIFGAGVLGAARGVWRLSISLAIGSWSLLIRPMREALFQRFASVVLRLRSKLALSASIRSQKCEGEKASRLSQCRVIQQHLSHLVLPFCGRRCACQ